MQKQKRKVEKNPRGQEKKKETDSSRQTPKYTDKHRRNQTDAVRHSRILTQTDTDTETDARTK